MLIVSSKGAPTAFGKTAIAALLIARRKVNTLIFVHRRQLVDQWPERLALLLGLSAKDVGQIGGGKYAQTGRLDVAVIQSFIQKGEVKDVVLEYGSTTYLVVRSAPPLGKTLTARGGYGS
jgi:superfamily II DNA or RNA helicase